MFTFDYFGVEEKRTSYPFLSPREYAIQTKGKKKTVKLKSKVVVEDPLSLVPLIDLNEISNRAQKILEFLTAQEGEHKGDFPLFSKPCENVFYRAGESFKERFGLTQESRQALQEVCAFYESKAVLKKSKDAFLGKPFLRYPSRLGGSSVYFYRQNLLYEGD